MAQRNEQVYPNWLLDAAGAPRKGRVVDDVEDDEEEEMALPGGIPDLGPPLRDPSAGQGGPPTPSGMDALAAALGGGAGGPPPGPGAAPSAPPPMPAPPVPTPPVGGLPNLPGGPPPPIPNLGPPPLPMPAPRPAPMPMPLPMPSPPPASAPPAAGVVGVGGAQAPGSSAPNLTITNSVVNVGQQDVGSQGGPQQGPQGGDLPPAVSTPSPIGMDQPPGPSDIDQGAVPDLGPPPLESLAHEPPTTETTLPAPAPTRIGPRWDAASARYG